MHTQVSTLLEKKMSRKEFMATLGIGVASVMGFGSVIKLLNGANVSSQKSVSKGYGASSYGN